MRVIVFGATGMVGQGVLRECLLAPDVERVLVIARTPTGQQHPKLVERLQPDLMDLSPLAEELTGYDACFFCLGVSSAGMSEPDYRRVTYDLTLNAARLLAPRNPRMTFIYVSGMGTDGRMMWARVKRDTERALATLPFKAAYMFRPGLIQPLHGVKAKSRMTRVGYTVLAPVVSVARVLFPRQVMTTEQLGRAMLNAARGGAPRPELEAKDLIALAAR